VVQSKKEIDQLLMHLSRMSILPPNSTLDDVLTLDTEAILARRLQTLAYIKGLASTPKQARQLISHGHIAIGENKVTIPGYLVTKEEEGDISYTTNSSLNDTMHPARPRGEFSSLPFKKQDKPKEEKPEEPKKEEKPEGEASKEEKPAVEEQTDKPEIKSEEKDETPKEEPKKDDGKPTEENNESETKVEEKTDELKEAKEDKKEESNKKEEN